MIRKILTSEYLKPYGAMSEDERRAYRERVGEWLASDGARLLTMTDRPMAKTQSLMSISVRWSKEDCEAVHEGARLMTALVEVADTWLPSQLWAKSAWRAIRQINSVLSEGKSEKGKVKNEAGAGKDKPAGKPQGAVKAQKEAAKATMNREPLTMNQGLVPVRPKHIDQYVHLLPKATQERAAMVKGLLRDLDVARENVRRLMEDGHASADSRAAWAKRAAQIDGELGKIYRELDAEWEKLVKEGRVAVDAFGNAYVVEVKSEKGKVKNESNPEPLTVNPEPRLLTSEQKHRRRELRKWLIDLRRGKEGKAREERIAQWRVYWKEYLTLEPLELALKDEKVVKAAEHFGIDVTQKSQITQKE